MKQSYNTTDKILLVVNRDPGINEIDINAKIYKDDEYTWFNLSNLSINENLLKRIFEKFYVLDNDFNKSNYSFVYDAIHVVYDDIVEKDRNFESNKIICDVFNKRYKKEIKTIVDLGCATGFAYKSCKTNAIKNIGIDNSRRMLKIAQKNGFDELYTPSEFLKKNIEIDCILMSYVFHLLNNPEKDLSDLISKVKHGGMICGNFFKNANVKSIKDYFKRLHWEQEEIKIKSKYNHGKILLFKKPDNYAPFINITNVPKNDIFFKHNSQKNIFKFLIKHNILPTFQITNEKYILQEDLNLFIDYCAQDITPFHFPLESKNVQYLNAHSYITYLDDKGFNYQVNSLLKNIFFNNRKEKSKGNEAIIQLNNDITLHTRSQETSIKVKNELKILQKKYNVPELVSIKTYMGTKKNLSNFILNIMEQFANQNTKVVDLMAGTGAIASAASNYWPTYASDAQNYSLILAESQGAGFNTSAKKLIEFLKPFITENFNTLKDLNKSLLDKEKKFKNSKSHILVLDDYKSFISSTPFYSSNNLYPEINIEVEKRKIDNKAFPYNLFSTYFLNHYLGVSQAIEVDSIRYAIDQIEDVKIKTFALSALLGSLAQFVSSYGGHVAQPKYTEKTIKKSNISQILSERSKVLIFDFFTRLEEIEKHSVRKNFAIQSISGPWQNALTILSNKLDQNTIVYLDPPYSREEFGRYYHLFETLVNYNYPSSIGVGRTPDKAKGERCNTEFASRNDDNIEATLIKIILKILENNWTCLWSYANNSTVRMIPIIQKVYSKFNNKIYIYSYATEHKHSTQGKKRNDKIIEYVIVFQRKN